MPVEAQEPNRIELSVVVRLLRCKQALVHRNYRQCSQLAAAAVALSHNYPACSRRLASPRLVSSSAPATSFFSSALFVAHTSPLRVGLDATASVDQLASDNACDSAWLGSSARLRLRIGSIGSGWAFKARQTVVSSRGARAVLKCPSQRMHH
jgi:hypothetical protein